MGGPLEQMMCFDGFFKLHKRNGVTFYTRPLLAAETCHALDRSSTPDLLVVIGDFPELWRGIGSQDDT